MEKIPFFVDRGPKQSFLFNDGKFPELMIINLSHNASLGVFWYFFLEKSHFGSPSDLEISFVMHD